MATKTTLHPLFGLIGFSLLSLTGCGGGSGSNNNVAPIVDPTARRVGNLELAVKLPQPDYIASATTTVPYMMTMKNVGPQTIVVEYDSNAVSTVVLKAGEIVTTTSFRNWGGSALVQIAPGQTLSFRGGWDQPASHPVNARLGAYTLEVWFDPIAVDGVAAEKLGANRQMHTNPIGFNVSSF